MYAQLKFYEFIHMAAIMAIDIGLGKNPKSTRSLRHAQIDQEFVEPEELERRRTYLVCYVTTVGYDFSVFVSSMTAVVFAFDAIKITRIKDEATRNSRCVKVI